MFEVVSFCGPMAGPNRWQVYATYATSDGAQKCFQDCIKRNPDLPWRLVQNEPVTIDEYQPHKCG